jgi:YidC/Oxa1 family membrane protein insertase
MSRYQAKMKRLQPRIDEIKKRNAKDPAAQRQEQAKLMQEEGAFPPLGGCLPMFLQIPVFIGLFAALRASFDLRHAPFALWIQDLSMPDQLLRIGLSLPLIGTIEYLNILPPLMVVLWIWQQKGMPVPADEQAARMQKMMMWMPVMMGFFLYNYAAGLSRTSPIRGSCTSSCRPSRLTGSRGLPPCSITWPSTIFRPRERSRCRCSTTPAICAITSAASPPSP